MPFTFAHPAIILPLTKVNSKYISTTALIIGSITPDFECFIRMKAKSVYSHTLPDIFCFDIPLAVIVFFMWSIFIRRNVICNLPYAWQRKFKNESFNTLEYFTKHWPAVILSLLTGISSHLLWDSFTHSNGYFVANSSILQTVYHFTYWNISLYEIIRNISSLAGVLVLIYALWSLPPKYTIEKGFKWYWPFIGFIITLTIFIRCIMPHKVLSLGDYFSTFIAGLFIGIIIAAIISENNNKQHRHE